MPACVNVGVQLNVPVPLPLFINVAPVGRVDVVRLGVVPSASVALILKLRLMPSVTDLAPIVARTGGWLPVSCGVK